MTSVDAAYYDGRASARRTVQVEFPGNGMVIVRGEGMELRLQFSQVRISARLGNTPRYLYLPDGARCEITDNDALDRVVERYGGNQAHRLLHFLESRYVTAVAALMITVGLVFATIEYGVPLLSRQVAFSLPQELEESLGREGLEVLDRGMFAPSKLDAKTRTNVFELFESLRRSGSVRVDVRLELRSSERLGANAFALPAGYVVITDGLVTLAESDEELLAVMAHEIGHVQHRHILRQILQNSLTALLVAGLFGDLTSIAGLSATLPTFLVQQKYSRQFEHEADRFAAAALVERNVAVDHLVSILRRLSRQYADVDKGVPDYLSSHPATDKRIESLLNDMNG